MFLSKEGWLSSLRANTIFVYFIVFRCKKFENNFNTNLLNIDKMKLMFFPVTMVEEFPHALLYYNFSRKKDRYFLSPFEVEISTYGSQRTVCEIIRSSDFLCGLLDIDRPTILKQIASNSSNITSVGSTTSETSPSPNNEESSSRRALSCSSASGNTNSNDPLLSMIEQRLDFKHRCMFYSTGPTSDLCGKSNLLIHEFH
jgi:hypothetical protein